MGGERIKLARKRAGLSLRDLAERMDHVVSAQAIGKYERGEMEPSSHVALALSKALGVSLPYLIAPQEIELGSVEFRRKANASAKDRARVETEVLEWVERYLQIEEILGLDSAAWVLPAGMPRRLSKSDDARALADNLRREWNLGEGPIPNLTELLEEHGVKVLLADLPDKVSGLTCVVKRRKVGAAIPVIVVNQAHTLERRRFSMAHELGHRVIAASRQDAAENLCHQFAGAFLVPKEHLLKEIGAHRSAIGIREIMDLKHLYRVSAAAFLMQLERTGVMCHSAVGYVFRTYASDWRKSEPNPLEDPNTATPQESPRRFERLVYRAVAEDMISISKAVELLRRSLPEVERELKGPA